MKTMKKMAVIIITILLGLLLIFQIAHAEIYKWVDEKGTVHFTEDPATIPEKYKDKAKSRITEEDSMTPEERGRARRQHEEEVRERLKREKKEYDTKELEKVKEIVDQTQKQKGECEIISYSQYDINMGGGIVVGEGMPLAGERKETCVNIVIRNNDRDPKTITERNIVATTSRKIVTKWKVPISRAMGDKPTPAETKDKFNPKAVFIQIQPGETYRGSICFNRQLPIAKLELQGL